MSAIVTALNQTEPVEFLRNNNGIIVPSSQQNVRLALKKLEIILSHDTFADRMFCARSNGAKSFLDDAVVEDIWLEIDREFGFRPPKDLFWTIVRSAAREGAFHPVHDYLDCLNWDGVKRIDTWLSEYGGAEDSEYVSAVGSILLKAAVRRVRQPGVKFDEMPILESPQGMNKSSGLAALCAKQEWFTDDLPLDCGSKEVIERTAGRWLIEASELSGMKSRDVEHLKGLLSRSVDIARLAYDRVPSERPRAFIVVGTTNSSAYLRDMTGNRRFWPVKVAGFDIEKLKKDRDQLWAEAATREAEGFSIRLPEHLWKIAGQYQLERQIMDPWSDIISDALCDESGQVQTGKIQTSEIWSLVGHIDGSRRTQEQNMRLSSVMQSMGFERKKLRSGGRSPQWHYVRGQTAEDRERIIIFRQSM